MPTLVHPHARAQLDAVARAGSGSYIFHGPAGMGKARIAYELARSINCLSDETCTRCRQFDAGSYPDLITIKPEDKPSILIDQVRGLVQALSLSLYYRDGTRVVVIDEAHALTPEAQNALLKLIEEPPPSTLFVLVTHSVESLLPTVRSRCVPIYFPRLKDAEVAGLLEQTHSLKPSDATRLAIAAQGVPGEALTLATDPATAQSRLQMADLSASLPGKGLFERLVIAKQLADAKADLGRLAGLLHARLVEQIKAGADMTDSLQAVETFRRQLAAKVAPRVALERLMVEL
jgi:DNA polymerase-3 subunit delta'